MGVAPAGGKLPAAWRAEILSAIAERLEIVSGLHDELARDPEFAAAAERSGSRIWDVRMPPPAPVFSGAAYDISSRVVLTVGSDCAVGKMTASLELTRAAKDRGEKAEFVATGQTGIMIAGWGTAIDRVISDFASGAAEQLVLEGSRRADLLFVEGQGGINNPGVCARHPGTAVRQRRPTRWSWRTIPAAQRDRRLRHPDPAVPDA